MQRSNQTSAAVFVSERPTEVFIVAVDPDDPNDPVFVEFVDEGVPSEVPDFLARETNRLADSKDPKGSEAWGEHVSWDRTELKTTIVVLGILGYLAALGILLLS